MSRILAFIIANMLFFTLVSTAQTSRIGVVKADEDPANNLSGINIYKYRDFVSGKVYFKDGDSSGGKLNLNYLEGRMDFLGPKGDTMYLPEPETIKYVAINRDTFYYENRFVELVMQNTAARLAVHKQVKVTGKEKIGAFGLSSNTANIESKDAILENQNVKLKHNENLVLSEERVYFISDKKTPFVEATKRNIMQVFSDKKKQLSVYFASNDVKMKNEPDLEALVGYLGDSRQK